MKTREVLEAIEQLKIHCQILDFNYKQGTGEYTLLSARSGLYELGYTDIEQDAILEQIAEGGFAYCLDYKIQCKSGVGESNKMIYPDQDVCYWGADQLLSRLQSLYWY